MSTIWFSYKPKSAWKQIQIDSNESPTKIKEDILKTFQLNTKLNIRVRNSKGNLVPINGSLKENTKKTAYNLELFIPIVRQLIRVDSFPRENRLSTALATKNLLTNYSQKISKLEAVFKYSDNQLENDFNKKLDLIENRLDFIEKRFTEVDKTSWQGSFKRPLLW